MFRPTKTILCSILLACCLVITGCGKSYPPLVSLSGKLTFTDGKPLPSGTRLYFHPVNGKTGAATAVTQDSGEFQVRHESGGHGLPAGKYTIQLAAPESDRTVFFKVVPKDYYDGVGLFSVDVKEGVPALQFKVKQMTKELAAR
jgi:hypothetical protein